MQQKAVIGVILLLPEKTHFAVIRGGSGLDALICKPGAQILVPVGKHRVQPLPAKVKQAAFRLFIAERKVPGELLSQRARQVFPEGSKVEAGRVLLPLDRLLLIREGCRHRELGDLIGFPGVGVRDGRHSGLVERLGPIGTIFVHVL